MIRCRLITTRPALFYKPVAFFCIMAITAIFPANAAPPQKNAAPAMPIPPAPAVSAVLSERPSRYIKTEELPEYIKTVSLTFSMKKRSADPFGQQQNPDAKPVIKATIDKPTRVKTLPSAITPFAEIVRRIRVTTVMPAERRFLIGTRPFKQGDHFPMTFRGGRSIKVEITTVSSREITFRNLESGETASLKLTLMPSGMTPGNGKITAPGMVPENANSPLDIEPASLPGQNSLN